MECALQHGEGGRAFFIADPERQSFREFIASLAGLQGLSIDEPRTMPYWFAAIASRLMDAGWAVMRREGDPLISRSMMPPRTVNWAIRERYPVPMACEAMVRPFHKRRSAAAGTPQ